MSNSNDPSVWMWAQACELMDQANRLHRQFFRPTESAKSFAVWEPPIDVFEDESELVVVVAMPGVAPERIRVTHEPGMVIVQGTRPVPLRGSRHLVRQLEIPYGGFERRIALPAGQLEADEPQMTQGCLVLTFRKLG